MASTSVSRRTSLLLLVRLLSIYAMELTLLCFSLRQQAKFPSFASVNIPMVLVLGNHSSGKSTFINHMLQQDVQKTGALQAIASAAQLV